MKFSDLGLKLNEKTRSFKFQDKEIKVKQYLPIDKKITLVQIALQQSMENGVYNEGLIAAYFHTYVIMFYTDLEFTDEEKQNVLDLYDLLWSEKIIDSVINLIPQEEIQELGEMLNMQQRNNTVYKQSAAYLIGQFVNELPTQMDKVGEIINNFDPSKYQAVIDFATAANGGRNINTNQPID